LIRPAKLATATLCRADGAGILLNCSLLWRTKVKADFCLFLLEVNLRDSRDRNLLPIAREFPIFGRSKKPQKKSKKSLPASDAFIKRWGDGTNTSRKPFKKTLKKVKKKLVSAVEI
jgi:hypothetical protein